MVIFYYIFEIVEFGVIVAMIDHPNGFKSRKKKLNYWIALLMREFDYDKFEFIVPNADKVVQNIISIYSM